MATDSPGNPASRELGYCPCCGYRTLPRGHPGSEEVCPICHWRDDPRQFGDTDLVSDANEVSLRQARENFEEHGACHATLVDETQDPPKRAQRDPNWPY
ncbi:CPCC family cysteine-rich protein [Haloarculaceae archaeon H-GB2-1]|nr:CPCC family cysteine-rich protein [Haloarculaceae archaeon H-GB1-1]MEA5385697.1 CPCC family cysteine-rich protein [Haloarculaceae archaeon H-GB11]MEA5407198.1 CPCC family cysteine-rich protein [Haloarculaceae archaeon H-GB2-1]